MWAALPLIPGRLLSQIGRASWKYSITKGAPTQTFQGLISTLSVCLFSSYSSSLRCVRYGEDARNGPSRRRADVPVKWWCVCLGPNSHTDTRQTSLERNASLCTGVLSNPGYVYVLALDENNVESEGCDSNQMLCSRISKQNLFVYPRPKNV